MDTEKLDSLRREIDKIDSEIFALYLERDKKVKEIGELKKLADAPVYVASREEQVINNLVSKYGEEYESEIRRLFSTIMGMSKEKQRKIGGQKSYEVVIAGTLGAYAEKAAKRMYPKKQIGNMTNFSEVFAALCDGTAQIGVLPVENSFAGSVDEIYSLLKENNLRIIDSLEIEIHHCLLAPKGSKLTDIDTVVSHPQALMQCSEFLKKHKLSSVAAETTASGALECSKADMKNIAAIASSDCAELYGLDILEKGIENTKNNRTRFIAVSL